jgi:hypothetical protein
MKAITSNAPHFGTPRRRIQRNPGVATMAMKMASRIGERRGEAVCNTMMTIAKAAATTKPRAGALKELNAFID